MSAAICVAIDRDVVHVARAGATSVDSRPWRGDDMDTIAASLRDAVGAPSAITLVVGLGWLEVALPELPPVSADVARAILWRDLDRHFALSGSAAIVCDGACAFAMPADTLHAWVAALRTLGPVTSIVTASQVAATLVHDGTLTLPAPSDELGTVRVQRDALVSVRRMPRALGESAPTSATPVTSSQLAVAGLLWQHAPDTAQLLDPSLVSAHRGARTRRTWGSVTLAAAAVVVLALSLDHWRSAQLAAVRERVDALSAQAAAAEAASSRLQSSAAEVRALQVARTQQESADAPLRVLAALTRVLPRDVVVQRMEWDGEQWRVEGTTDKAPRLVPLLDADAFFRDVRTLAPSQRFLDIGRQRETFTIGFHTRAAGGASGAL